MNNPLHEQAGVQQTGVGGYGNPNPGQNPAGSGDSGEGKAVDLTDSALDALMGEGTAEESTADDLSSDTTDGGLADQADGETANLEEVEYSSSRRNRKQFGWSEVEHIWNFGARLSNASALYQSMFQDLTECYGSPIDIAKQLMTPMYRHSSISMIIEVIEAKTKGDMLFMFELGTSVGEMEPEAMRSLVKVSNLISENFTEEGKEPSTLAYRRNMNSNEVAKVIITAMWALNDDAVKFLNWSLELLDTWPSDNVIVE